MNQYVVTAELDQDNAKVHITFAYDPLTKERVKQLGARFVGRDDGGPYWWLRPDLDVMRRLREEFGRDLKLGPRLKRWGREAVARERVVHAIASANDAELERVPNDLTWDNGAKQLRPYQRADIKFMASTSVINANQPGSGKTAETILSLVEAGLLHGFHLITAPLASLRNVWQWEIFALYEALGEGRPYVLTGDTPAQRRAAIAEAKEMYDAGEAFWLVINPYMVRNKRVKYLNGERLADLGLKFSELGGWDQASIENKEELSEPALAEIGWTSITIDEFHDMGLSNSQTLSAKGLKTIVKHTDPVKRYALSGTPMRGKPIKLFGALNFLDRERFSSKWDWARLWLVLDKGTFGTTIEGIQPGKEEEFAKAMSPYLIRRTKRDALPGLPPKVHIDVWCGMSKRQEEQYRQFQQEAEWRLESAEDEGKRLSATSILAEYTRLKQFADGFCDVVDMGGKENGQWDLRVEQTTDSGKLLQLEQKLSEEGVFDEDVRAPALIFSQFNAMAAMVAGWLDEKGVTAEVVTGNTKKRDRDRITAEFQDGIGAQVLVMNTLAGQALNLSRADSVHMLDETWVPDQQEQAEDRAHRGDELTMAKDEVRVYMYRTANTIEELVMGVVRGKRMNNTTVLDLRRAHRALVE